MACDLLSVTQLYIMRWGVSLALRIAASQFSETARRHAAGLVYDDYPAAQLGWTYDNRKG